MLQLIHKLMKGKIYVIDDWNYINSFMATWICSIPYFRRIYSPINIHWYRIDYRSLCSWT
jgi:hypothetical protein